MRNPIQDEDAAFRLVLGTIAYLAPIVVASWIATWLGVAVFVVASVVAVRVVRAGTASSPVASGPERAAVEDTHRILVVTEAPESPGLQEALVRRADGIAADLLLVCPFAPSRAEGRGADDDDGRAVAGERLRLALERLRAAGLHARGELAASDPLGALEGALSGFTADELVIWTRAPGDSPWLERGVVQAARRLFDGPVTHLTAGP